MYPLEANPLHCVKMSDPPKAQVTPSRDQAKEYVPSPPATIIDVLEATQWPLSKPATDVHSSAKGEKLKDNVQISDKKIGELIQNVMEKEDLGHLLAEFTKIETGHDAGSLCE